MHESMPILTLPKPRRGLIWNPYFQILLTVVLTSAGQILLKIGADGSAGDASVGAWLGVRELADGWTWLGILAFVASFGSWLYALRFLPLGLAFSLTNGVHVLVPLGSWFFLHEQLGPMRIAGIAIINAGVLLLAQSVAHAEEKV
jgi:multidrug transporter EmrE-like cation transporter